MQMALVPARWRDWGRVSPLDDARFPFCVKTVVVDSCDSRRVGARPGSLRALAFASYRLAR
jgi:hypothetical protein